MSVPLRFALLTAVLLSTQAAATEFSFVSGNPVPETFGNSYSQTLDGLTATATAWSTTGQGGRYETAQLAVYDGGIGVCSRAEGVNCSGIGNMNALNNVGSEDLILFSFSHSVQLSNLTLLQFSGGSSDGDSDLSLWAGTGSQNLANLKPNDLGHATLAVNTSPINDIKTVDLTALVGNYDWLAVSARLAQRDDFAKLLTLNAQAVSTPVPEADTWAMLLAGVGLIGFAVHRRGGLASRRHA